MKQKSKYDIEIENFRKIKDYNVVGLLDRNKSNIGQELCDIKVIAIDNIEDKADIIIINSDPSNYEIIFKRISNMVSIPVYYSDGRLARIDENDMAYQDNSYWSSSYNDLKRRIDNAQIVSFDIFDTLIMRKIFSPEDVFRLLGSRTKELNINTDIGAVRAKISAKCDSCASIDDIYMAIKEETDLSDEVIEDIKTIERDIDEQLCVVRNDIAKLYEYCIESGKEVICITHCRI